MLWFLDTLVSLPVARDTSGDGLSVIDARARRGDSPPYHVHTTEDEIFHVVDGELVLLLDGTTARLSAGETLLAPKGVPHTYRVVSEEARWLAITARGDFERFVCEASRPATAPQLPPPSGAPTQEQQQALAELAHRHNIELIGPPLAEAVAAAAPAPPAAAYPPSGRAAA